MKKTVSFFIFYWLLSLPLVAQIQKGKLFLETSMGITWEELAAEKAESWEFRSYNRIRTQISPQLGLGYFISDKIVVGLSVNYSLDKTKTDHPPNTIDPTLGYTVSTLKPDIEEKTSVLALGGYVRYFFTLKERFYVTTQFDLWQEHQTIRSDRNGNRSSITSSYISASLSGTLVYTINDWLGIQLQPIAMATRVNYHYNNPAQTALRPNLENTFRFSPSDWQWGVFFVF